MSASVVHHLTRASHPSGVGAGTVPERRLSRERLLGQTPAGSVPASRRCSDHGRAARRGVRQRSLEAWRAGQGRAGLDVVGRALTAGQLRALVARGRVAARPPEPLGGLLENHNGAGGPDGGAPGTRRIYFAAMPSMPGGGPVTLPIEVSVPSSPTRNSSTVPVRPVSTYRKPPLETRSIVPEFVVAATAASSSGRPSEPTRNELTVLLPVFETK